jgi:hypothetical protein
LLPVALILASTLKTVLSAFTSIIGFLDVTVTDCILATAGERTAFLNAIVSPAFAKNTGE